MAAESKPWRRMETSQDDTVLATATQYIILFYKYHALSSDRDLMELYRQALHGLCESLNLNGRILVGISDRAEGINGTLAGSKDNVTTFTQVMLGQEKVEDESLQTIVSNYWREVKEFCDRSQTKPLVMGSPNDFKWSETLQPQKDIFPDLNIKLVKEMISTGGVLSDIPVEDTGNGYMTPEEWHDALSKRNPSTTMLVDCRNIKECQVGYFEGASRPNTQTFSQFPQWVQKNRSDLKEKETVYMYCTGGIRCEKASAYIRQETGAQVMHLQGGIHKYIEQYGKSGHWKGRNFVFDGRIYSEDDDEKGEMVGECVYCQAPHEAYHPANICTVCREPTLVCNACSSKVVEVHCQSHQHLRSCYFTDLHRFSHDELNEQREELGKLLSAIAVGRKFKQRRKTLQKQCEKIRCHLESEKKPNESAGTNTKCRSCGEVDCDGACWGFHSLKRKDVLQQQQTKSKEKMSPMKKVKASSRVSCGQRKSKQEQKERSIAEIQQLRLSQAPSTNRCSDSGLRLPPCCTRLVQTMVKGKWCGKSAIQVVKEEFVDVSNDFDSILNHGLLRINGEVLDTNDRELRNMDAIQRIVHWHEPPVIVPAHLSIQRVDIPASITAEYTIDPDSSFVYVANKPPTVPVHPAGPYLSNTLTMMMEAQLGLEPRTLFPCHRIDRPTGGLTICAPTVEVSRVIQSKIDDGSVTKLYIAKVRGRFSSVSDFESIAFDGGMVTVENDTISVCAPVKMVDALGGRRCIDPSGKESKSLFQMKHYNAKTDTSLILCRPITGRGHQLRVHLQGLGFPIVGDVLYGDDRSGVDHDELRQQAIDTIVECTKKGADLYVNGAINEEDQKTARVACRCCQGGRAGIEHSFSTAQLLGGGHAICLFATRYDINFNRRQKENIGTLQLQIDIPDWASDLDASDLRL